MPTYFDGNLVYIHIPKCAGKNVRQALCEYQEKLCPSLGLEALRFRWHESLFEIQNIFYDRWGKEKWDKAPILSTIRHPIDRAVSWWKYNQDVTTHNYNFRKAAKNPAYNIITSCQHKITPEDYHKYNHKNIKCKHESKISYINELNSLSFEEYLDRITYWKKTGCEEPSCPYHALEPQIYWLRDANGVIPLERMNLILLENLDQIAGLLPNFGDIGNDRSYFEKAKEKDYTKYLTTKSLIRLRELYAEDFELYDFVSKNPPQKINISLPAV